MTVAGERILILSGVRASMSAEEGRVMAVALATKRWTLEELHRLPDDGNKYELVRGELFVTPAPTPEHEEIAVRLARILEPYVVEQELGYVYRPRAVVRFKGSEVEPDLMVRQPHPNPRRGWAKAPIPVLVIEIVSPYTRRRDAMQKRELYLDASVEQYWIVDGEERSITVVQLGEEDVVARDRMVWQPTRVSEPLTFALTRVFEASESGAEE